MKKDYPLVEAIFELRWGEVSPGKFKYSNHSTAGDVFLQKFTMQALKKGYEHVEKVDNSDIPPLPHRAHYRFRREEGVWPCLQVGLGVFTVNQIAEGYEKCNFLGCIEEGINVWRSALGDGIDEVLDTLTIILRRQDFFPEDEGQSDIEKLKEYFGISLSFPEKFLNNSNRINNIDLSFSLKCEHPAASMANVSFKKALSGGKRGLVADTVVFTKYSAIVQDSQKIKESIQSWIEGAHDFQIDMFNQLMKN